MSKEKIKLEQYYVNGKETFDKNCANCHQKNGQGLAKLYPAITAKSLIGQENRIICLMRYGSTDTLQNPKMPPNSQLLDLDIAELVTYIYTEFAKEQKIIPTDSVHLVLEKCKK